MGDVFRVFKDMGTQKILIISIMSVVLIVGIALLIFRISMPSMTLLYTNLDTKDSGQIVSDLEAQGIPYELRANGTQILVPEDKVVRTRMSFAQKGMPVQGSIIGYEIFDQAETLGTSHFIQNVNLLRALEGELARSIGAFSHVDQARVHLVMPKRELFAKEKQEPSASVVLTMKGNNRLTKEEVKTIAHMMSSAVPGLNLSRVTIVDTKGQSYKLGGDEGGDGSFASGSDDFRVAFERRMKFTIEDMLEKSLGVGRVIAHVSAEINFDRIVSNSERFDPDGQVVRSVQTIEEKEINSDKSGQQNTSVTSNLPAAGSDESANHSSSENSRLDETTNYEISKTIENHIRESGTVERLSIAVLVDGNYLTDKESGDVSYEPRTDEELQKLTTLVKSAVGFNADRNDTIDVVNMQFITDLETLREETVVDWLKRELPNLVQTLVVGIVAILVILLVVRPIAIRAFELTRGEISEIESADALAEIQASARAAEQEPEESMIDIEKFEGKMQSSTVKSINDIVVKYPQETASIIRRWLNTDS